MLGLSISGDMVSSEVVSGVVGVGGGVGDAVSRGIVSDVLDVGGMDVGDVASGDSVVRTSAAGDTFSGDSDVSAAV